MFAKTNQVLESNFKRVIKLHASYVDRPSTGLFNICLLMPRHDKLDTSASAEAREEA
jgi:hypothetical protein